MKLLVKKLLPFLILIFVVLGCTEAARQEQREAIERARQVNAGKEERKAFANKISNEFELPGSRRCVADFFAEGDGNRTLRVSPCSLLTERGEKINLYNLFSAETMREVKALGFNRMETEQGNTMVYRLIE